MNLKEEVLISESNEIKEKGIIENINCSVGGENHFIDKLNDSFRRAKSVDIIVAFLMESGVKLLKNEIESAINSDCKIRILTGNYLGITEPSALYLMKDVLGENSDLRFYSNSKKSFHPKAYIFYYKDGKADIFIGSSNISKSALTSGIEWNYRISREKNEDDFNYFKNEFENLFFNESIILNDNELKKYSKNWRKPKVINSFESLENEEGNVLELFSPRGAQIEALTGLRKLRSEGYDKGIVIAATGIGKTYLSAFDSKEFKRVLFVAHREEILKQARESFKNVRKESSMGFFNGEFKEIEKDIIFASVQTLGKDKYLKEKFFKKDYFEYIIIDEFHHSVSKNYKNIINYFKPKFLLGITATPERMDNKDIFSLCDYNIAYEIRLAEAINKNYLVPFRYYGIYDEDIDYEKINKSNGKFKVEELEKALMINKRGNLILQHYKKYNSNKALGFCTSKSHAEYMAKYFSENGIKSVAVYSSSEEGEYKLKREEAIKKLKCGEIKVIFSIDMFNEGVDIKSLDMIMFLRPTESSTVFLQQLGRGLRKSKNKEYVNVLDFIGNYKKALLIPELLGGNRNFLDLKISNPNILEYPQGCLVDFDFRLVDMYEKLVENNKTRKERILNFFEEVREELGKVPTKVELIENADDYIYSQIIKNSKENFFKDYLGFLNERNLLDEEEKKIIGTKAHEFIKEIENTSMSKTYKMPILLAFYNDGDIKLEINEDDIYFSMKKFYSNSTNGADLLKVKGTSDYKSWDKKKYISKAKEMPLKFLSKSSKEFFSYSGENFKLSDDLKEFLDNEFFKKALKDTIDTRVIEYYKSRKMD